MKIDYNSIYNIDCIEGMKSIDDKSIDFILCDLPYGTTKCKWDIVIPFVPLWEQYSRVIKDNGAIVLTSSQPFTSILIESNIKMFRYCWVWEKSKATGYLNAKKMPMKGHENVLVFYRKPPTYNPQITTNHIPANSYTKHQDDGDCYGKTLTGISGGGQINRYPRSVLEIPVVNNGRDIKIHPTQKPVELMQYFIQTYSNIGDVVLDNTMGSGSTGVACKILGRKFIGIEIEKEYFDHAERWITETEPGCEYRYQPQTSYGYLKSKDK